MKTMKMMIGILILGLALTSCSPWQVVLSTAGIAGVAAATSKKDKDDDKATTSPVIEFDRSGMMLGYGGMLLDESRVLHVAHYELKPGTPVRFRGKDGTLVNRTIAGVELLENDLAILSLNAPLDLANHEALPVGPVQKDQPITVTRRTRPDFGTYSQGSRDGFSFCRAEGRIEIGDSGWPQVQAIKGKAHVVSLTSTVSGKGPDLAELLRGWVQGEK